MADYLKKRPMLFCAIVSAALCIAGFYSQSAVFFCGIALIILFFLALYFRRPAEIIVTLILAVTAVSILLTSINAADLSKLNGDTVKGEFTVVTEPEDHGTYFKNGTQKRSYYADGIFLRGSLKNIKVENGNDDPVLHIIGNIRKYIKNTLFSNMEYDEAATVAAITIGDRSYFSDEFYSNIKKAGVSHVMVVSGMHLSVIVGLTAFFIKKHFYNKYLRAIVMFATVLFMAAVCGFTKSILRAGFCSLFVAASILSERDNTAENSLGGAAALLFIISPFTIFSVSFQLSFLSTLGIVSVAMPCLDFIKERKLLKTGAAYAFASAIFVTLSATLFTLPVSIYTFGYISNVSVFTNLLIDAVAGIALQISAVGLLAGLCFPHISRLLFIAAELAADYINRIINLFGSLPFATSEMGTGEFYASLLLVAAVIAALLAFKKHLYKLRLDEIYRKIASERGRKLKWL